MTTAKAIKNEPYLKISNLCGSDDFNYAVSRLKEITYAFGDSRQADLLMGRLMIKRDKLIAAGK